MENNQVMGAVSQRDADQAIGTVLCGIAKGLHDVTFNVVPTFCALPADVLSEAARQNVTRAKGLF